ncbi:calpain-9-like isoform X1 [Sipha flava]|uniref:Calpain-9-like isoform X1 n=3 Tax=Sipha flava TaxID=143950 RepID=A0A8B8FTW0_9HEMI|nr:calpain-9-like isoform X1 [Sipha flava]XP_025414400.1 calpain-9-like isoform X1 [Sipha flava]
MSVEAEHGGCWDSCVRLMCHNHSSSQPSNHRQPYPARHLYANGNKNGLNGHIKDGIARNATKTNGVRPEEKISTVSRGYWTVERPRQQPNYHAVRRSCRERGALFDDPDFPAGPKCLYKNKRPAVQPIVWMRPHEMCQRPKFMADSSRLVSHGNGVVSTGAGGGGSGGEPTRNGTIGGGSSVRCGVEPGELGDHGFLAAVSSLTLTPKFLDRVVPMDQSFDTTTSYCGLFRFRFWYFGEWKEVLVDDKLPTYRGRLVYMHSTNPTEFWAALLEKAYAKLYGCYENISGPGSSTTRALQDLTGGIVQSFGLSNQDRFLTYQVLNSAVPRSSLLISTITLKENKRQLRLRNGLMTQHAYSVTGLARVRGPLGDTPLVRLRNPWGEGEWTGPWSERSWEWDGLSNRDKELLSVRVRNDGEFWMSFEDFARHFTQLDIVHVSPDDWMTEPALHSKQPWRAVLARRRWRSGYNAGGGPGYPETTAMNPQFHIGIPRTPGNKCHVVVSVVQQYETDPEAKGARPLFAIGFAVYEVPHSTSRLTSQFVAQQQPLDVTNHSVAREVVTFFTLPPGDYIVVPQTNVPNCDAKFLLRILTDEQSNIWEVNDDNMVFKNISAEFLEDTVILPDGKPLLTKLMVKYPPELDVTQLQKILRAHWKAYLAEKPSLELCKSLIMLRDINISGRINMLDIPVLMHMLQFWKIAFQKFEKGVNPTKTSSYNLRPLLWEAGSTVSNKVLECLVLRFAKNRILTSECFIMAMVRLHLAHERYHSLDTKMSKGNPLSLEELILMTIYS